MKIDTTRIVDGKLLLKGRGQEFYLPHGVYRRADGQSFTVHGHQIQAGLKGPYFDHATAEEMHLSLMDLEDQLSTLGDDAQMANLDLQNMLQKQQQTLQTLSNVSRMLHDALIAIVRRI
jgi:hypothetical protein